MEDEARHILLTAAMEEVRAPTNLYAAIRRRIVPLRGVELDLPGRRHEPPDFD